MVAPRAGAWIETNDAQLQTMTCHVAPRACGLSSSPSWVIRNLSSHPVRVRDETTANWHHTAIIVAPVRVRELSTPFVR